MFVVQAAVSNILIRYQRIRLECLYRELLESSTLITYTNGQLLARLIRNVLQVFQYVRALLVHL